MAIKLTTPINYVFLVNSMTATDLYHLYKDFYYVGEYLLKNLFQYKTQRCAETISESLHIAVIHDDYAFANALLKIDKVAFNTFSSKNINTFFDSAKSERMINLLKKYFEIPDAANLNDKMFGKNPSLYGN